MATVRDFVATDRGSAREFLSRRVGQHDLNVVDGYIQVPARAGQGVELVEEVLHANLAQGEPYWN